MVLNITLVAPGALRRQLAGYRSEAKYRSGHPARALLKFPTDRPDKFNITAIDNNLIFAPVRGGCVATKPDTQALRISDDWASVCVVIPDRLKSAA